MNEAPLLRALEALGPAAAAHATHRDADGRPRYTNRLVLEGSLYLRQHAHQPIDWRPWGADTLAEAAARDVPILLSSGYSACHWCHVMARDAFEDEPLARFINAHFVPTKLDREERPDVDACWMEVLQAMTGHGGWPMTLVLTPSLTPLFAGTFLPLRDDERGRRMGLESVLTRVAARWREPRFAAEGRALMDELAALAGSTPARAAQGSGALAAATSSWLTQHDAALGGFGRAPKFPRPAVLDALLRRADDANDADALRCVERTLEAMACGGLRDHVAGGFARYSTDAAWRVPHFEKMLYDNAQLAATYTEAWRATRAPLWAEVARETLAFIDRVFGGAGDGGFAAALDADSDGAEGRAYTWTPAEVDAVLPRDDARWVRETWGVTPEGHLDGRSVLHLRAPLTALEGERWARLRPALARARSGRPQPALDPKVVTAWNGLAITAFARAAVAFDDPALAARGARAAAWVLEHLRVDGRTLRSWSAGRAVHPGVLEDVAAMVGACLALLEATHDVRWLDAALELQAEQDARFADTAGGGYWRTGADADALPLREKPEYDGAEPSGNALAAENLVRLFRLTGDERFRVQAEGVFRALDDLLRRAPTTAPRLVAALEDLHAEPETVVIVGPRSAWAPLLNKVVTAGGTTRAGRLVLCAEGPESPLARRLPAHFAGRTPPVDPTIAAAYVCRGATCAPPVNWTEGDP